jgi:asparagine synthase (glutamine-hydrolysing)
MELFFLLKDGSDLPPQLLKGIREEFFDSDSLSGHGGNYTLFVSKKTLASSCCHYSNDYGSAFGTGTFIYRMQDPDESLRLLLEDFMKGCFDSTSLSGHYYIFLLAPSGLKILTDATFIMKAFHDSEGSYLTSSFLLAARLHKRLTLNRAAATENLLAGGITGSETVVNEISCLSKASFRLFSDIEFVFPRTVTPWSESLSKADAVKRHAELLDSYFMSCSRLAETRGADIGLTGGYDSRLVLAFARKHIHNLQVHSHYRPAGSEEWRIARRIAEEEKIRFVSPMVTPPEEMDDNMLHRVISGSFRFNDGMISLHCNWMEEYNTREYRLSVLGDKRLGFNGIGGEQYRNQERLYIKPWLFSQWLKYSYIGKISGNAFLTAKDEQDLIDRIKVKMCGIIGCSGTKRWMDLNDLKRIQNEVVIAAYRGALTNAENRHAWHLSPLADFHVAASAYGIIRYLKDSKNFEADLIRTVSPSLAAYPTNYGYDLLKGEPFSARIFGSAFENLLPGSLKWRIRERFKTGKKNLTIPEKIRSSELLMGYLGNVIATGLPVSVPELANRNSTAHMVIALGYLLEKLNIATDR